MQEHRTPRASIRVRVPFVDVDSSGRIHFTAMFRYMEFAEHALMRSLGLPYAASLRGLAFPRVHLECDFRAAITFDDLVDVEARVERVGGSSWTIAFSAWRIARDASPLDGMPLEAAPVDATARGDPAAVGRMTIVAMDPATEHATALPTQLRHALTGG